MAGSLKRKAHAALAPRKKTKTRLRSANDLPWTTVSRIPEAGVAIDEGILDLEEVEGVEVVYEETAAGRVARFNVVGNDSDGSKAEAADASAAAESDEDGDGAKAGPSSPPPPPARVTLPPPVSFDASTLLPEWASLDLHPRLGRALHAQNFRTPTAVQQQTLTPALAGRDVIGVAETGSGKTLAYGLPILHTLLTHIYTHGLLPPKARRSTRALILAPTRELALQVSAHLNACLNEYDDDAARVETEPSAQVKEKGKGKDKNKGKGKEKAETVQAAAARSPPLISVAAIVGGMSAQKQRRILERGVDVLVATPGRLWDIIEADDALARDIKRLRFLVLDEADRMIETGHFAELDNILRLTQREFQKTNTDADFTVTAPGAEAEEASPTDEPDAAPMQTFIFSATLSKDLQRNLRKRRPRPFHSKHGAAAPPSTLDDLLLRLDLRDAEPAVVDLSPEGGAVASLVESKIECLAADKDVHLYYFLLRYPGRTLVFLSAIDGIRRLLPVLTHLTIPAFPLHSHLEQRQRLKNLDRFRALPSAVLLATDVAARGLDVPAVDHVVHYQLPRTADAYVHRNGRTARARREGFSLLLCAPDERRIMRALLGSLGRQDTSIGDLALDHHLLDRLKARLHVAKQLDTLAHRARKAQHERSWLREAADAMDIELGSELEDEEQNETNATRREEKHQRAKTAQLKAELARLLAQPLVARGVSTRYITSGSVPIVDDLVAGDVHREMIGVKKTKAGNDVVKARKRKQRTAIRPKEAEAEEEYEEWTGLGSTVSDPEPQSEEE